MCCEVGKSTTLKKMLFTLLFKQESTILRSVLSFLQPKIIPYVLLDDIQVVSLKADCDLHTAEHTMPEFKFKGHLADGCTVPLDEAWEKENFREEFCFKGHSECN